ncbi:MULTISPECIES: acyltransferase family protein [unclassified Nocardioides]|uniref:acyltransferase family protein n=1 Tax=unclassified Nocardioides TaxID=2615069 RepID=UPI0009E8EB3F|nr:MULTISPECIES: acyltransferase family protein [unclassified Nocardioides]
MTDDPGRRNSRLDDEASSSRHEFHRPAGETPVAAVPDSPLPSYLGGVQGLRTVAALLVAIYHIWFHRVSGGVDVFFVVAGYFAAKSLLRMRTAASTRERVALVVAYWMRTLRRITPSAVVVITGTVVAGMLFLPESTWEYTLPHGFAALLHHENQQLIASGADYLQQDIAPSPFQQFWALSLQVQIYLTLPVVLLLATSLAAWLGRRGTHATTVALLVVLLASFAFSVWYTAVDQPAAYFSTFTRYWELVAGAVLFLVMRRGLADKVVANALGWVGLGVLVVLGATLDVSTLFPGWVALVPVTAAVLIMVSSASGAAPVVLSRGPLAWFGHASFAFYLWHWPILVTYRGWSGHDPGVRGGLAILVLSAVLAHVTTRFVETPVREWKRLQGSAVATLVVVALLVAPAYAALSYWQHVLDERQDAARARAERAAAGGDLSDLGADELVPAPSAARLDLVDVYDNGCHQVADRAEVIVCESGVPDGSRTIVVVGGSHSAQWIDVVRRAAVGLDARVLTMTKSGCLFADIDALGFELLPSCSEWAARALDKVLALEPDLVVTTASRQIGDHDEVLPAYRTYFEALDAAGIPVLGIRDNPRFPFDPPVCVETKGIDACARPRSRFYADDEPRGLAGLEQLEHFAYVDVADLLCPDDVCPVVQGHVLVYRDPHHMTRTWTLRKGGPVEQAVIDQLDRTDR